MRLLMDAPFGLLFLVGFVINNLTNYMKYQLLFYLLSILTLEFWHCTNSSHHLFYHFVSTNPLSTWYSGIPV